MLRTAADSKLNDWTLLHAASYNGHLGVCYCCSFGEVLTRTLRCSNRLIKPKNGQSMLIYKYKANGNTLKKMRSTILDPVDNTMESLLKVGVECSSSGAGR